MLQIHNIYNLITTYDTITNTVARQDIVSRCEAIGVCMLERIVQGARIRDNKTFLNYDLKTCRF